MRNMLASEVRARRGDTGREQEPGVSKARGGGV